MAEKDWRGSFAIPMTPYDEQDRIDEDALRAEIRFCVECGVGGVCVPLMVSEFFVLSEDERDLMVRVAVEECAASGIPVVANCAGVNKHQAVRYARCAQEAGADAVMAMPPYVERADFERVFAYYQAISDAVALPIWIQNAGVSPLGTDQIVRLCTELEHVGWVKEEVSPSTHHIGALVARQCPAVRGVMGGGGGRYLITERARGSLGAIHACQFCDVVQRVWELLDRGEQEQGEDLFDRILPGLMLEGLMGMAYAKEVMVRRGVLKNSRMRSQSRPLDAADLEEIDRVYRRIEPYLIWHR